MTTYYGIPVTIDPSDNDFYGYDPLFWSPEVYAILRQAIADTRYFGSHCVDCYWAGASAVISWHRTVKAAMAVKGGA